MFSEVMGQHCYLSCMANLLNLNNMDVTESDLAIVGDGLYCHYQNACIDDDNNIFLGLPHYIIVDRAFSELGISYKQIYFEDNTKESFLKISKDFISKKKPLLLHLNTQYLKYNVNFTVGKGRKHNVILQDLDEEYAYIIDPFFETRYTGKISRESLLQALIFQNGFIYIDSPSLDQTIDQKWIEPYLARAIRSNLYPPFNSMKGLHGIAAFAENIIKFKAYYGDQFSDKVLDLAYMLKYAGMVCKYRYLENTLKSYYQMDNTSDIIVGLNQLSNAMQITALLLYKYALILDDVYATKLQDKFKKIIMQEKALMSDILEFISDKT